ncbi:DUF6381 family protein [Streptomyces sp. M10(2022)]
MSVAGEFGGRAQQIRAEVQELNDEAERTSDPEARKRLTDKARRIQEQSEQERSTGIQNIDPI